MKRFYLFLFSWSLLLPARAQNLNQTFAFAAELQARQDYQQALLTYQRVLFFDEEGEFREEAYQQLGACYFAIKEYEKAATYFDLAYFSATNDSLKMELLFQKTSSLLLNQNFEYAQAELLTLPDSLSPYFAGKRNFFAGITYYNLQDFKLSETYFQAVVGPQHPSEKEAISRSFRKAAKTNKVNPTTAKVLSSIVPGLGQVYAGDWKNGINSLLLTSGFAFLAYQSAVTYSFMDAVASVGPWYQRYYMGGYQRAEQIALAKRKETQGRILQEILTEVARTK